MFWCYYYRFISKWKGFYTRLTNKHCPIRTCASCEFTYWGGIKADKACPECGFAHYGAVFSMGGWCKALISWAFNKTHYDRVKNWK